MSLFALGIVILAGVVFLNISSTYHAYVVTGHSMEPAISKGDVVIVGPYSGLFSRPLAPGAIISFQSSLGLVTHRVAAVNGQQLTTRGDAVGHDDPWTVSTDDVAGVVLARIPKVGLVPELLWAAHGLPVIILAFVCVGLAIAVFSPGRLDGRRSGHESRPVRHPGRIPAGSRLD